MLIFPFFRIFNVFAYTIIYVHKIFPQINIVCLSKLGITIFTLHPLPSFEKVISKNRFWFMWVYLGNKMTLKSITS